MKKISIIDKIVYGVGEGLTVFGLLMFLFLPMISVSATVLSSSSVASSVTIIDFLKAIEFNTESEVFVITIVILALFVLTMILALVAIINLIIALTARTDMKCSTALTFAILGVLASIAMFVAVNIYISSVAASLSSYVTVSTGWVGSLIVCGISLLIPIIYANAVRPNIKFASDGDDYSSDVAPVSEGEKKEKARSSALQRELDVVEAIRAYKRLLDEEAITLEEYDKKKSELLK